MQQPGATLLKCRPLVWRRGRKPSARYPHPQRLFFFSAGGVLRHLIPSSPRGRGLRAVFSRLASAGKAETLLIGTGFAALVLALPLQALEAVNVQPRTSLADSAMLPWDVREGRRRVKMRMMVKTK
jgi:hypothetical protein